MYEGCIPIFQLLVYPFSILQVNKHQCGSIEELEIFNHELSRKHLGVARLIFENPEGARICVKKLNNSTLMGKVLQVFLDPFGEF